MHVSDGVLSVPMLTGGFVGAGALCAWGAAKIREEEIPRIAVFAATFFVASLIHFKVGATSVHLLLCGLVGVVLGRRALLVFPVSLTLQFLLLSHGGLTTIGVNSCVFGVAALSARGIFLGLRRMASGREFLSGAIAGGSAVLVAGLLLMGLLLSAGEGFRVLAQFVFLAHLPVMIVEGIATGLTLQFLHTVSPQFRQVSSTPSTREPPITGRPVIPATPKSAPPCSQAPCL